MKLYETAYSSPGIQRFSTDMYRCTLININTVPVCATNRDLALR